MFRNQKKVVRQEQNTDIIETMRNAILVALEDERYTWRTVWGIARSTGIDPESCWKILNQMDEEIIIATNTDKDGNALWTTRARYKQFTPWYKRFMHSMAGGFYA